MPAKPDTQGVLDLLAQMGGPALQDLPVDQARAMYAVLRPPGDEEVASVSEHTFDAPAGPVRVRAYRPVGSAADERLPALVWFHGGGWVIGDLDTADAVCRPLANRSGTCVLSVDYHLAPEHPYPAAVDDAVSAVRWAAEQADALGIDAGALAVGGESAGGNLAAVVAQVLRAARGPQLRFQALVYPVTDLTLSHPSMEENGEGYLLTRDLMVWFVRCYIGGRDATNPRVSPLRATELSGLPPAIVVTGELDPLRDEGDAYAAALAEAGVAVEHARYEGQIHDFMGLHGSIADGDEALSRVARAVSAALRPAT